MKGQDNKKIKTKKTCLLLTVESNQQRNDYHGGDGGEKPGHESRQSSGQGLTLQSSDSGGPCQLEVQAGVATRSKLQKGP